MITNKTSLELVGLAQAGAALEVDGDRYNALELIGIAHALSPGAYLIVHNSNSKTTLELQGIAQAKKGQICFK